MFSQIVTDYTLTTQIPSSVDKISFSHLLWEQGVGGSNPLTPTLLILEELDEL